MSVFRKNIKRVAPEISTASLPDVVFILLFFFMVSAVFRKTGPSVKVALPSAKTSSNNRIQHALNITIATTNDSSVCYFGKNVGTPEDLISWLTTEKEGFMQEHGVLPEVLIRADANTPVAFINQVKKSLRDSNLLLVRFMTNKKVN